MRPQLTLEAFADWCEKQPAGKRYVFVLPAGGERTKHTPGPWKADDRRASGSGYSIVATEVHYCRAGVAHYVSEQDAPLIAASPDLLSELKRLRLAYINLLEIGRDRILALGGTCDPVDVMEAGDPSLRSASAIISKAEGTKP